MLAILLSLGIFYSGCIFGSFSTVLIDRWRKGTGGIMGGRSECPQCHHTLGFGDLFPLFSFLFSRGRCRYCNKKISSFYPLAELMMGSIFLCVTMASIQMSNPLFGVEHLVLISLGFVSGVYMLYDILYQEIPDQIMVPSIYVLLGIVICYVDILPKDTFHTFYTSNILNHLAAAWVLYTFFYIQILIPGSVYFLRKKAWKDVFGLIVTYFAFPILIVKDMLWKNTSLSEEEIPAWIGGGDLRIALFIGLSLGWIHGIVAVFLAYIIGSIVGIGILMNSRQSHKKQHHIAFGPFLGIGWILSLLFWDKISLWINMYISYIM